MQSLQELADLSDAIERGQPWPGDAADGPRGRTGPARRVALPEGWLESRLVGTDLDPAAETATSGG